MGRNFDEYPDFPEKSRGYRVIRHTVAPQNDCLNLSFVKDIHAVLKK